MPNRVNFGGQQIIEPGGYSDIKGRNTSVLITGSYGKVMIIDTGIGAGFGGGAGILGETASHNNSIYHFSNYQDFKKFVRGGVLWALIEYLFSPSNSGLGAQEVIYARAATTTAPTIAFSWGASGANGAVTIQCLDEGAAGNGVVANGIVTQGYGAKVVAGTYDVNAFSVEFYQGQYRGLDADGIPYDGMGLATKNSIICKSPEFTTMAALLAWMTTDVNFKTYFKVKTSTTSTNVLDNTILTGNVVAASTGTTVYSVTAMDTLLEDIAELDVDMFIATDYGVTPTVNSQQIADGINKGALSTFNQKLQAFINVSAENKNIALYIGGGQDSTQFKNGTDGSYDIAAYYNDANVIVVHSAVKVPTLLNANGLGYTYIDSLFHAAMWCGRAAGVEPQVNLTFKDVRVIGVKHVLSKSQREDALLHGVGHLKNVPGLGWVINQGINTLQTNDSLVYNDGTSPEISVMRIFHQLNKEIKTSLTVRFPGGNLATVSDVEIKNFVESALQAKTATSEKDNLIIGYNNVVVQYTNGAWNITYCFFINSPINRIFSTGFAIDPSLILQ